MNQSILKYFDSPISISKIHGDESSHVGPILFICQPNQYDYIKSSSFGYDWMINLWSGTSVDRKVTWKGKYGNLSFDAMSKELFTSNYSHLAIENGKLDHHVFSLNLGICKRLSDVQYRRIAFVNSHTNITLLVVDPNTLNDIRVNYDPSTVVTVGPSENDLFEWADVIVEHSVTDLTILDGDECRDYRRIDYSYRQCVNDTIQVLTVLGLFFFHFIVPSFVLWFHVFCLATT